MNKLYKIFLTVYITVLLAVMLSFSASAYIDPATATFLVQLFAGIFITLGVVFGVFRSKVAMFFKSIKIKLTERKIKKQKKD